MWLLKGLLFAFVTALLLSILAMAGIVLVVGDHPECAMIPGDVGPCGIWPKVAEWGPYVIGGGTLMGTGVMAAFLLTYAVATALTAAAFRLFSRKSHQQQRSEM
ncbi:hypothetical protein ACWDYH_36070 [Nocardia goodfellowii]